MKRLLTDEQEAQMIRLLNAGSSAAAACRAFGVGETVYHSSIKPRLLTKGLKPSMKSKRRNRAEADAVYAAIAEPHEREEVCRRFGISKFSYYSYRKLLKKRWRQGHFKQPPPTAYWCPVCWFRSERPMHDACAKIATETQKREAFSYERAMA